MADLGWMSKHGAVTAFAYLAQFFMAGTTTPSTSGNAFEVISRFITFTLLPDVPTWLGFALFVVLALPWIFLAAHYLFQLFNNVVTGALLGVALVLAAGITAIVGLTS